MRNLSSQLSQQQVCACLIYADGTLVFSKYFARACMWRAFDQLIYFIMHCVLNAFELVRVNALDSHGLVGH